MVVVANTQTERLQQVRRELKDLFIERDELVDGVLCAVLARQHVLMLGPPGTAKSLLAREVCRRVSGGGYFQWLLTKFTTPEEIFGPISLSELEQGRYERVTGGKLPEARVAFLDEVFKANSAILNALLTVLNERQFHQGTRVVDVPLQSLLAASNELPEEDELAALYDRFLLRFTVGYIEHDFRFARLLRLDPPRHDGATTLAPEELAALQAAAAGVEVPDQVLRDVIDLRRALNAEGVVASDRRYRQAVDVLRAAAALDGRAAVEPGDLRWLNHVLWSDPEEKPKVAKAIAAVAGGADEEAQKLVIQAEEIHAYATRAWPDQGSRERAALEAHTKLQHVAGRLAALRDATLARGRDAAGLDDLIDRVAGLQRRLLAGEGER
jgi:MoxR-like ATPase